MAKYFGDTKAAFYFDNEAVEINREIKDSESV